MFCCKYSNPCLYVNLQDTRLPEAMSDAQSFHWETVDTKYVVNKQSKNSTKCGSCLFQ